MFVRAVVANSSSREVDRLAVALAARGILQGYVRPFISFRREWPKIVTLVPGGDRLCRSTVGRRESPAGLSAEDVVQVGHLWDFLLTLGARAPFGVSRSAIWEYLLRHRDSAVSKRAAELAKEADLVVAASCVAQKPFESVHLRGGFAVLNYQAAHHQYVRRIIEEEMELQPEFALTLRPYLRPSIVTNTLDAEVELADHILVGSSFAKASFIAEGVLAAKISAIPYGTDLCAFAPSPRRSRSSQFRILFVGQISQLKGISYLLKAYRSIRRPETILTLVGNFTGSPEALDSYREDFQYIPHVPYGVVPEIFRNADVFVFPTLADGMGLAVLEAMASGLPAIVTANGPGDLIRDGVEGFVVPIRDAGAIAERLEFLRANPDIRMAMARAARLRAEQFGWDVYARKAADLVLDCLKASTRPARIPQGTKQLGGGDEF